jgi:hypothetical protein
MKKRKKKEEKKKKKKEIQKLDGFIPSFIPSQIWFSLC